MQEVKIWTDGEDFAFSHPISPALVSHLEEAHAVALSKLDDIQSEEDPEAAEGTAPVSSDSAKVPVETPKKKPVKAKKK